jgi:hypothetical protein
MLFRRKKPAEQVIEKAFKARNAKAIGLHSTTAKNLKSIQAEGIRAVKNNILRISKRNMLKTLRKKGKTGLLTEFIEAVKDSMSYIDLYHSNSGTVLARNYCIVTVKAGKQEQGYEDGRFRQIDRQHLPPESVLATVQLTETDIASLAKKHPAIKKAINVNDVSTETKKMRQDIARTLAKKLIRKLLD